MRSLGNRVTPPKMEKINSIHSSFNRMNWRPAAGFFASRMIFTLDCTFAIDKTSIGFRDFVDKQNYIYF